MREPEIYRDPTRDAALIDLSPYLRLSLPMALFAKYGALHADWDKLNKKLDEVYSLLQLGSPGEGGTTLAKVLEESDG